MRQLMFAYPFLIVLALLAATFAFAQEPPAEASRGMDWTTLGVGGVGVAGSGGILGFLGWVVREMVAARDKVIAYEARIVTLEVTLRPPAPMLPLADRVTVLEGQVTRLKDHDEANRETIRQLEEGLRENTDTGRRPG